jgi:hypothetical protein
MLRSVDRWLIPWLTAPRRPRSVPIRHVVLAVCDHFEPLHDTDQRGAAKRVASWRQRWPNVVAGVRDSGGRGPRHTFFYPIEQYRQDLLAELAGLSAETGSEVEVHLHHDNDTPHGLRTALRQGVSDLRSHGFLGADPSGVVRFGFIHGNWALDHSDPRGKHCGVPNELGVLRGEGCYADFTMPSAPHPTQARMVNRLYYAPDTPAPRSHDTGTDLRAGATSPWREDFTHLLCVQGPLALNFRRRKLGVLPRVENSDLTGANPPSAIRLGVWLAQGIHVAGRPDTVFIKLHTHGAIPANEAMFLDGAYARFLADFCRASTAGGWRLWFASAREMVNIAHALEDGHPNPPGELRDYLIQRPPLLADRFG